MHLLARGLQPAAPPQRAAATQIERTSAVEPVVTHLPTADARYLDAEQPGQRHNALELGATPPEPRQCLCDARLMAINNADEPQQIERRDTLVIAQGSISPRSNHFGLHAKARA